VVIVPVASASGPTKSDHEVARVVPVGSVGACTLVVLEVGKVAIVVLDIVDGLTLLQLVLCRLRQSNRRSRGRAKEGEKSGSELHVVKMMVMMIEESIVCCDGLKRSQSICSAPVYIPYLTARSNAHGSTRCLFSLEKPSKLSSNITAPTFAQAIHKRDKQSLSLGHGAQLRIQPV